MSLDSETNSIIDWDNLSLDLTQNQYKILRQKAITELRHTLRKGQLSLADWQSGAMAVSAVPGAGKSTGMAVAAAIAVARHQLNSRHQLIVVTFTRSAAASIKGKIRDRLKKFHLPQGGFVVNTLHGLALNIATRHPELSGLNLATATIVIPTPSHRIIRACVEKWLARHPSQYKLLLEGVQFDGEETERLRRQSVLRTEVLPNLAYTIIHEAKSSGLLPQQLWQLSQQQADGYNILGIGAGLYEQYQQIMRSRDFVDYDDMILAALQVLENPAVRQMWQQQVFAVFEDEAQDSSPLQEKLLKILATDGNGTNPTVNLVRVGDPNQAINSTFTPADPLYFNWFCDTCKAQNSLSTMDQAGRSSQIIIDAANFVLHWVNRACQVKTAGEEREMLLPQSFRLQNIRPVDPGDPQRDANPKPEGAGLEIYTPVDICETVDLIGKRIKDLFTQNPQTNAAVLVRENRQGRFVAEKLHHLQKEQNIPIYEVGEAERHSHIPIEILKLLKFLDRPHSPDYLKGALEVLEKRSLVATQDLNALATFPEQFLYPSSLDPAQKPQVEQAKKFCCNLLKARLQLPHYQLISFLALSLQYTGSELATAQKLAERISKETVGKSSLQTTLEVLGEIVNSEQFEAVGEESEDQYTKKGQLTIITMHKAKGLDWDYVFLPFLHEDSIPGKPWVPNAAKFLGNFTLAEVARAQIRAGVHSQHLQPDLPLNLPQPEQAWQEAGYLKKAEEFRLLYVAMTRAKRLLWMSAAQEGPFRWNTFRSFQATNFQSKNPCPVIPALKQKFPNSVQ
ncbi:MAG: ATP-dependent helicase [Spirulinaceae cyanobacterium]